MNTLSSLAPSGGVKNEIARDLIALGGLPFYFLVIARTTVGSYPIFLSRIVIALVVLFIISRVVKDANLHIARALILAVVTSLFYEALPFTIFALIVWGAMVYSLTYLKVSAREIVKGTALGIVSVTVSYFLTLLILPILGI
jgi:hypothetical protein